MTLGQSRGRPAVRNAVDRRLPATAGPRVLSGWLSAARTQSLNTRIPIMLQFEYQIGIL